VFRLVLDSSTKLMWIGLTKDDQLVDFYTRVAKRDHAKYMVDAIDNLLKKNNISIKEIKEIVVGSGPGSYTGLRVAGMVSKMLAYTLNIPLFQVSSIYFLTSGFNGKVLGMIDARRTQYFVGIYEGIKTIKEDSLMLHEDILKLDNYNQYQVVMINEDNYQIDVSKILKKKTKIKDIHKYVPNYLRKTEAEMKL
jgi:tRNA threonylcarbamoyladenosine biosynthesis protein TsaB